MKWYSFLSASFLLGTVIAVDPVHQVSEPTKYRLMVTTHGDVKDIDDNYLSCDVEGNVGIFGTDREPILIHDIMPGKKSDNLVFFDTRPGDELFHGLSLLGWQGNMHLKDILYPNRFRPENDTDIYTPDTYSWNEFWFTEGKNGMKELFWGAKGEHPGWVAVPLGDATYFIRWYDETGSSTVAKGWDPVKIYLQPFEL